MRNDILHREDNAGAKMECKHLTEELLDFKYNATKYLRYGDRGQINYPDAEIMRWMNTRKEGMLKMLRGWRQQYQLEVTLDAKKQCALTKFGFRPSDQAGRQAKATSHAPDAADKLGAECAGGCARQTEVCLVP